MEENEIITIENNSGQGENIIVPDIVSKKFNWGAFLFTFVWCIRYKKIWQAIVAFLLWLFSGVLWVFNIGFAIYLGINGNKWAWQARQYASVDEFHQIQKKWTIFGLLFNFLVGFLITLSLVLPTMFARIDSVELEANTKKALANIEQAEALLTVQDVDINDFSSEGLTNYFMKGISGKIVSPNSIESSREVTYTFFGKNDCKNDNDCYVEIDVNGKKAPNRKNKDIVILQLKKEENSVKAVPPDFIVKNKKSESKNEKVNNSNNINKTSNVIFDLYLKNMQRDIKANWNPPNEKGKKRVVVLFKIAKDGKLLDVKITQSSGSVALDNATLDAIKATKFQPLPKEYKNQSVDVSFTFDYNNHS